MNDPTMACVEAARRGDEDAAARWVAEHHARIYAFLRRLCGSEADATELTQRAFCRAWGSLGGFAGRSKVSVWLHGIAYRTFVDWLRSERRMEVRGEAWWQELPDPGDAPDRKAAESDGAGVIHAAVDRLGQGLRETVHLHYYQGLTLDETAEAMGVATSTVKYRLRQALDQIKLAVGEGVRT